MYVENAHPNGAFILIEVLTLTKTELNISSLRFA